MLSRIKTWADSLKRDGHAIYLASRDPRVPWYAKALAVAVAGYALSPIDLIPDFIPVIGYLDELIILPLGIWLVVSLIPDEIMIEYRAKADEAGHHKSLGVGAIFDSKGNLLRRATLAHALRTFDDGEAKGFR